MEKHRVDIRDLDGEYFEGVEVYLDREMDQLHFPKESADRLGELDEEVGCYWFLDGEIRADPGEIDGEETWVVEVSELTLRPSRPQQ